MSGRTYLAFDLDGTLYDATAILVEGFTNGIKEYSKISTKHITIPGEKEILAVVGLPLVDLFGSLFPGLDEHELQDINDACSFGLIKLVRAKGGELIRGVRETLQVLHESGYPMLIASNGRIEYIEAVLEAYTIDSYFDRPIICPNESLPTKSDVVREYINMIDSDDLLIMIGDRKSDKLAAEHNNIPFIACSFGHADKDEIGSVEWAAHSFDEIADLAGKIESNRGREKTE